MIMLLLVSSNTRKRLRVNFMPLIPSYYYTYNRSDTRNEGIFSAIKSIFLNIKKQLLNYRIGVMVL